MQEIEILEPVLIVRIARLYRDGMSSLELYEATRGVWKVGDRRNAVQYALAVASGIVREVYTVGQWYPAGHTPYATRQFAAALLEGRWEFTGVVAPESIRNKYVGKSVAHYFSQGNSNPVLYLNA